METLEIILDKVCDELEEYGKKLQKDGKMSAGDLEMVNKLIDIKKNILKTRALEEDGGYSQAGDWEAVGRINGRYGDNYDHGNSYRGRLRDSMGRYSGRSERRDYSRNGGGNLMGHIDKMMDEAETSEERKIIERFKRELEHV